MQTLLLTVNVAPGATVNWNPVVNFIWLFIVTDPESKKILNLWQKPGTMVDVSISTDAINALIDILMLENSTCPLMRIVVRLACDKLLMAVVQSFVE